jgi:hypothetical protein
LPRNLKQAEPKWKLQSLLLEISPSVPAYTTEEALRTHMWCWRWHTYERVMKTLPLWFRSVAGFLISA